MDRGVHSTVGLTEPRDTPYGICQHVRQDSENVLFTDLPVIQVSILIQTHTHVAEKYVRQVTVSVSPGGVILRRHEGVQSNIH